VDIDKLLALSGARRRLPEPLILRHIRERAQVSQEELAEIVGVDRASVSRWENGTRTPKGENLLTYIAALERLEEATGSTVSHKHYRPERDPETRVPALAGTEGKRD
jgi:transcriptional regulator with XRE-family HTH domain